VASRTGRRPFQRPMIVVAAVSIALVAIICAAVFS
jgi:hypothetical protein